MVKGSRPDLGSSPRMRGAARVLVLLVRRDGIIPTYAGSSGSASTTASRTRDHPRACGEQRIFLTDARQRTGSSPRMRGAAAAFLGSVATSGIIPAHAGSRPRASTTTSASGDHPRACGEQLAPLGIGGVGEGSSPRMRGAGLGLDRDGLGDGIIPAHAGSSFTLTFASTIAGDHPRACGEQAVLASGFIMPLGSSPRMRGAVEMFNLFRNRLGIIPAHAGSRHARGRRGHG